MLLSTPILTDRLLLRSLREVDATERYVAWLNDPDVVRFLESRIGPPQTTASIVRFIETSNASTDTLLLGIFLREGNIHIGNIKIGPIITFHRRGDLGFLIGDRSLWGRGFATEAIIALCRQVFFNLPIDKITAGCYEGNDASVRTLMRAGFRHEATLREHWVDDGKRISGMLFGLLRTECPL